MIAHAGSASVELALHEPTKAHQDSTKAQKTEKTEDFQMFGDDGLSFWDFLDIINPLQHIPVVSTLYRSITGDEIDPAAKIAGGTLYGGPIGAISSIADVAVDLVTGKDIGEHAMALATDDNPTQEVAELPSEARLQSSHSNPYLARAGFAPESPSAPSVVSSAPVLAQSIAQNHGMTGIPVAKQPYLEQVQSYLPPSRVRDHAPDLGMLGNIQHLEKAGLIEKKWTDPTLDSGPGKPIELTPEHNTTSDLTNTSIDSRIREAQHAYQKMASTSDEWLISGFMKGMDGLEKHHGEDEGLRTEALTATPSAK